MSDGQTNNNRDPVPRRPVGQRPKDEGDEPKRPPALGPWLLALLLFLGLMVVLFMPSPANRGSRVPYSFFRQQLEVDENGNVAEVEFIGDVIAGKWKKVPPNPDPKGEPLQDEFNTVRPPTEDDKIVDILLAKGVKVTSRETAVGPVAQLLMWLIVPLVFLGLMWMMLRRNADPMGTGMIGNFIRSPAKRFRTGGKITTFNDVAAMEQAKSELSEIVDFLKDPTRFQKLGAEIPKGVLLVGPPGTGKTLLARATAGEAGVPFYSISGSEFIQMFVGVGASRVRDLFRTAKENSPCIIFIDEIDAVGRVRGAGVGGGHDEREQTLNQILSEMDGFTPSEAVIVVAATNRPDVLDPALLRPGRFDRHITIDRPTREGRAAILKVHARKVPLADDVDLNKIAGGTIGFSGADLRNLVNEAALIATRQNKTKVDMDDFEAARDRVLMGPLREEVLNEHEREMTAYHEAGHALLAWLLPDTDELHKVTIIPRGRALGVTQLLPSEERYNIGEKRLHQQLTFVMGGRAAEKLVFDEYSAGAEDDLNKATRLARRMVAHWGMSDLIGPVMFRQAEEHPFLGKEMHEQREFSEETAHAIDQEVQRFLTDAAERATQMLTEHRDDLDRLAQALLEKETLGHDEITELIGARVQVGVDGKD
jgi:cell division protease FtsH